VPDLSLLADDAAAAQFWPAFHQNLTEHYDLFAESLGRHLSGDELLHLLTLLLIPIARSGFATLDTRVRLFGLAQAMGVHILPVHFYSPIPDTSQLSDAVFDTPYSALFEACQVDVQSQLALIDRLATWGAEMADTPADPAAPHRFYWNNPALGPMDATVYHAMVRELKPSTVLEIGSGYSTMVAARAAVLNGSTSVRCIEPHPPEVLRAGFAGLDSLVAAEVQSVPLDEFKQLEAGDILFIDSSHVSKIGSDVNYIALRVLPILKEGVVVHFHDIFLPDEVARSWVTSKNIFWNEQHIILAFLLFNSAFKVLLMHNFLGLHYQEALKRAFPFVPRVGGGSLWIQRTNPGQDTWGDASAIQHALNQKRTALETELALEQDARQALEIELEQARRNLAEMQSTRAWRLARIYWQIRDRLSGRVRPQP
jgi:hypothetical protein